MAFKTLKPKREPVKLEALAAAPLRQSAVTVPRNSGQRRTASKQALLKAIEQAGGKW